MCCGSPEFLKQRFGEGYNLVIVKNDWEDNKRLEDFIMSSIQGAKKLQEVSTEATFLLPKNAVNKFKDFFPEFERKMDSLGVSSYGLSMSTLEEVFLWVERESTDEHKEKQVHKVTPKEIDVTVEKPLNQDQLS